MMKNIKIDADVAIGNQKFKAVCEFIGGRDGKVSIIVHIKDDDGALSSTSTLSFDEKNFRDACDMLFESEENG